MTSLIKLAAACIAYDDAVTDYYRSQPCKETIEDKCINLVLMREKMLALAKAALQTGVLDLAKAALQTDAPTPA